MDENAMRRAIERKRAGEELRSAEWEAIVSGYVGGSIDDAQMAAMAMACVWRGMSIAEAAAMTRAMVASGTTLAFPPGATVVDKHSSGGVSDAVSLIAVPMVAACGVRVAKLSGPALGHTGGTIDKLKTIPGFNVNLPMDAFVAQVERVGCAIAAQSEAFVPADKRLYGLRDRTGTIPSRGLIAASIVSKKIAGGAASLVFDVKCGSAAFMHDPESATELAGALVEIAKQFGREARAIISDMNEPLGRSIGTGLEIIEARDFLRGDDNSRIRELCLMVAQTMLDLAGVADARTSAARALDSGAAYEKFVEMVEAQGGSRSGLEAMAQSRQREHVTAESDGFVAAIDAVMLGNLVREWTQRDAAAGVRVSVRVGDRVERGIVLAQLYGARGAASRAVRSAYTIGPNVPPERPLIYAVL